MKEIRELSESERNWAMLCHLSAFAGFFFPFGGIIGPLICWLSRKDESLWVDQNGKAISEFPVLDIIVYGSGSSFMFYFSRYSDSDFPVFLKIICIIIASVKASKGEEFKYPVTIPFIQ